MARPSDLLERLRGRGAYEEAAAQQAGSGAEPAAVAVRAELDRQGAMV